MAQVTSGATPGMISNLNPSDGSYDIDKFFRGSANSSAPTLRTAHGSRHLFTNALTADSGPDADRMYLAALIAQKMGATPEVVQARVNESLASISEAKAKAKAAADAARKAAPEIAPYTALSMLLGASSPVSPQCSVDVCATNTSDQTSPCLRETMGGQNGRPNACLARGALHILAERTL